MKLVEDWKEAWKWLSVRCPILAAILLESWNELPTDLKECMPHNIIMHIAVILLFCGIVGRVIRQ